jgi:Type I phosphodiesterase / nucleotide pyrophosphatase
MDICRREFGACLLGGLVSPSFALPPRPRLLVLIVLELLRPDFLDAAWSRLAPGGLRRLLESGAYFPDCRNLASTFGATSLATLATGTWPAEHGIVADTWFDGGSRTAVRASGEELLATTLAAQVAAQPRTRVYVIAMEEAHAGLVAGTRDARLFWMDEAGRFNTRGVQPDWLGPFNARKPIESLHDAKWLAVGAPLDAPPLRVLTYDAAHAAGFTALYKSSPFAQQAQFDLLDELVTRERLGRENSFDLVCLVASSSARLGYETGDRSPLIQQTILQFDLQIEALLGQLNRGLGPNTFNLVVAGGHGAPPEPSAENRERMAVPGENIAQAVEHALVAHGLGHVDRYLYPFLYLDTGGSCDAEPVRQAAAQAAMAHPAVAGYYTAGGACSVHNDWERRFRNSFHPKRSGDVMLSYRPEYVEDYSQGRGISYGSLYNYEVRVPLCFYGPQFRAGVFDAPVESVDLAPTLVRAVGVAPPSSATGRVLAEALAE